MIKKYFNKKFRALSLIFAIVAVPFFSGCGTDSQGGYVVNLEVWGTFDDSLVYAEIINQYKALNPYVGEIKYRKFAQDSYRQELVDALASGQGPDIFLINNGWFPAFENKVEPAPGPLMSEQDVKANFPDVVAGDFIVGGKVYAVPLSIDSLALYYNKDMFNAAGITSPPVKWDDFDLDVKKLTKIKPDGSFALSGAAFGTGTNVSKSADVVSLLMMQNGVNLPYKKGIQVKLEEGVVGQDGKVFQAGEQALGFYTNFAKLSTAAGTINPSYTWNARQHYSIDAFAEGSVAMTIGYSFQNEAIKKINPKLNFAVASVPQIYPDKPINNADYWAYAVARNKVTSTPAVGGAVTSVPVSNETRVHEAWQFLRFLTLKNSGSITLYNALTKNSKVFPTTFDPAIDYLKKTAQPAARRDIIELQKNDTKLGPFATGNLISKHWYQIDPGAVEKIFVELIESVNRGDVTTREALTLAGNRINYLSGGSTRR